MNRTSTIFNNSSALRATALFTLLSIITIVFYQDIFSHTFINFDDQRIITNRIDKYDGFTIENMKDIFFNDFPREEPLIVRDLSYLINAEIFGVLNPLGYLLGNLILHILASYLIYQLSLYLFPKQYAIAAIAAIIFAIHPVNVESVAWISSRKNPLFTIFLLLSLFGYIKYTERLRSRHLLSSALLFPIALLSKAAAISLFPILICYRFTVKRELKWHWAEVVYFTSMLAITLIFFKWYSGAILEYGVNAEFDFDKDWLLLFLSACEYITFYISKLILPLTLSPLYDFPAPSLVYQNIPYLAFSLLITATGLAACLFLYKKSHMRALFLVILFVCALAPYLGLAGIGIYVADRYLYLSSAAYAIGIAWIAHYLYKKYFDSLATKRFAISIITVYCVLLGIRTMQTTTGWKNTFSFWLNANQSSPNYIETYRGLMDQYTKFAYEHPDNPFSKTALKNAKSTGQKALKRFCTTENGCHSLIYSITSILGNVYALEGDYERSEHYYETTFRINPDYLKGRYHYANDLLARKEYKKALAQITYIESHASPYKNRKMLEVIRDKMRPQIPSNLIDSHQQYDGQATK